VLNTATGDRREAVRGRARCRSNTKHSSDVSNDDGTATFPALSLTGTYTVTVSREGFGSEERTGLTLRSGETASLKVALLAGSQKAEVTVYGTVEGVRADPQVGLTLRPEQIDETPLVGRKTSSLPLLNSAFRQGKGTGDLFVNQTYFITGAGARRTTTFTLDGANNDEAWGRQTAVATIPLGAIQEMAVMSNAFSAEFGWTAGPALNIVTKSGTNDMHGEGLFMIRPGDWQAKTFSTDGFVRHQYRRASRPRHFSSSTRSIFRTLCSSTQARLVVQSSTTALSFSQQRTTLGKTAPRSCRARYRRLFYPLTAISLTRGTIVNSCSTDAWITNSRRTRT
jgi:hypothetical protein